ncbi:MAG: pyridoxal-phosphate dependent enzyme [Acidobacteriota bacterium]|nr:pyridoxal-phosphate dependent enzyme [Acidobacteriota bacterium]MDH3524279.1 pyridoxal-phosphate dependent enzyme [Acidobacteriota bacterium]
MREESTFTPPSHEPASAVAEAEISELALLGGAEPEALSPFAQLAEERRIAADPRLPLADRLEAFEDIMDSEVGDTNLTRARNVERQFGIRQLYLKFDGGNPTGTQKDRIAFLQVEDAMRRRFDSITVATCGNYGAALALAASVAGLRCVIFVPGSFHTRRSSEMEGRGAELRRVEGDYEASVEASGRWAREHESYDANPGGANTSLQLQAYGEIAFEIYDELRDAPAAVAVPVSNGTTLAGIHKGFVRLYRRGKTSRIPKMIAGSSSGKNPIVRSFLKGLDACEDLDPARLRETAINEPLINWHSADGQHALDAIRASEGWAGNASDRAMQRHSKLLREVEGLSVLPASSAGLAVLLEHHQRAPLPGDRYVAVLTGRR